MIRNQIIKAIPYTPHEGQLQIHELNARFRVAVCGRRFGKTMAASREGIDRTQRGEKQVVWWIAPSFNLCRRGWNWIETLLRPVWNELNVKEHLQRYTIELKSKKGYGIIEFKTAESPDSLIGEGVDFLIFDEPSRVKPKDAHKIWDQCLYPTLVDKKGDALFIGTPLAETMGQHNLLDILWAKTLTDIDWKGIQLASCLNPYLSKEEIEKARACLPKAIFDQEFGAQFIDTVNVHFQTEKLKTYKILPEGLEIYQGVDPAIRKTTTSDFFVDAVIGYDRTPGDFYIIDIYRNKLSFNEQVRAIIERYRHFKTVYVVIETVAYQAALKQYLDENTDIATREYKAIVDKVTRATRFMACVEKGKVYIPENASWKSLLIDELIDFPGGEHDDQVDAIDSIINTVLESVPSKFVGIIPVWG